MGGNEALTVGLEHPERFAWVGAFSASVPPREVLEPALANPRALDKKLRWLWLGCGKEDGLMARNKELVDALAAKGVKHIWRPSEGGHAWPVWRAYLIETLPQLFAPATASSNGARGSGPG
jgi:enterochelin esterase family protein